MKQYVATVHLLLDAKCENEAADIVSALLTENGLYRNESGLTDWSYLKNEHDQYEVAREVEIADDYDRDEADLDAIARPRK